MDIFILPSLSEGLPIVLLEAMAAECPILATNVGGVPAAIKNGINGLLIKAGNSEIITYNTIKLLKNKKMCKTFTENGLKIFDEKFSAKVMTKKYENLYLNKFI